ncbi:putative bifunctional diguanylate cyclase/phosphodiesterase [Roseovarius tibetensis]|uniref:putative bifunctional diguanylate cyclase/phosphodiesterase n=1 Tax=Roseovarius tibetensis TaxID=2685897 RepID=UPI003D7FC850
MGHIAQYNLPRDTPEVEALFHQIGLRPAAHHDDLTQLATRQALAVHMRSPTVRGDIARRALGVLVIDIDNLKDINARLGHGAGDAALCHVAQMLRSQCGDGDLVCRTGEDEFNLVCTVADGPALRNRAETVRRAVCRPLQWQGQSVQVSASIGVCLADGTGDTGEDLIQRGEIALEVSKTRGRGCVVHYTDDMGRAQRIRQQLEQDLEQAVRADQFEVHLQPQLSLSGDRICGCEALIRWRHPRRGVLSPADFMEAAGRQGFVAEIDHLSMTKALDALKSLHAAGFDHLTMSINVSAAGLADPDYPDRLDRALQARGLRPDRICVELLETTILDGSGPDVETAILRLKRLGVRVALDDFGTGYAGVAHMASMDVDEIKLDRSMVARLDHDPRNRVVVRGIIRLCRMLQMVVVAEGVETMGQLRMLRRAGCPVIQGFGLARPMPLASLLDWLPQYAAAPRLRDAVR